MSTSPEGRKRPRQSDADERDVKRVKNVNNNANENGMESQNEVKKAVKDDSNGQTKSQEWVLEQMSSMEKLYKVSCQMIFT